MAYNIVYKKSVEKDLSRLGVHEAKWVLDKIEKELFTRADQYPTLKGQFTGLRKLRVGNYRVIFVIDGQDVLILRIGHRREIYK